MGDFAAWPRSRSRALAIAAWRDTRSTQVTNPAKYALQATAASWACGSSLRSSAAAEAEALGFL